MISVPVPFSTIQQLHIEISYQFNQMEPLLSRLFMYSTHCLSFLTWPNLWRNLPSSFIPLEDYRKASFSQLHKLSYYKKMKFNLGESQWHRGSISSQCQRLWGRKKTIVEERINEGWKIKVSDSHLTAGVKITHISDKACLISFVGWYFFFYQLLYSFLTEIPMFPCAV